MNTRPIINGKRMPRFSTPRRFTRIAALAIANSIAIVCTLPARAQWKPAKTVEIVVALAAGSFQDHTARLLQKIMQEQKLVPANVSVVNRPGGGGNVGWSYLASRAQDPHYLLISSPTILTANIIGGTPHNYSDFSPVATLSGQYIALAVNAASPIGNGRDLLERLKKDVTSVTFANNGRGSSLHILMGLVAKSTGADVKKLKIAIFQGGGELVTAALGGHVDVISTATSNLLPHHTAGRLRIIGIGAAQRLGGPLADVPTWREQGVDAVVQNWSGVLGAKGMTAAQLGFWNEVLGRIVKTDEWKAGLERNAQEAHYLNSSDTAQYLQDQHARLRVALTDLGLAK